jgi:homoaconitase/3-isopropylmalate dehydratase large subunit
MELAGEAIKKMTMEQGMVLSNRDILKIRSKAGLAYPTVVFGDV